MSANLDKIPGTYHDAARLLGKKTSLKVAHNTWLERGPSSIRLRYHATDIVTYYPNDLIFTTGGWATATTKARIARVLAQSGYALNSFKGMWFISPCKTGIGRALVWAENISIHEIDSILSNEEKRA